MTNIGFSIIISTVKDVDIDGVVPVMELPRIKLTQSVCMQLRKFEFYAVKDRLSNIGGHSLLHCNIAPVCEFVRLESLNRYLSDGTFRRETIPV